ncbi:U1 small nuclear ribonucleoprotein C [Amborella trichopoda]|uniref:U1 small nuclear ribonucleoprotein C n=1 Tax=Amborella trichopoda TaxID=13333 RepID=U5D3M5_AMBTC|nr:U1 small nuclear ribonucleoprotein C [Amborella trichopoda]XP_011627389.1 U1 small nuclear ribonucleoprotein C [Amborella trichopoda]ERN16850.1 hypothetical protein AMTR_s00057p00133180 [Amborella trichopoda]|eukprot:XP_006855383.1 U1 small nuclear ribonucleoprotein C [Amborella trichopoda]
MPRYYCDYCDTYLTHDSPSVRKQHNAGYKHKANVRSYYQQFEEQQTQSLIDQKVKEHLGQTAAFQQQVGVAFNQHLMSLQSNPQRPRIPVLPPVLPIPSTSQAPINPSMMPMLRPPLLPPPTSGAPGYSAAPGMTPLSGPPGTAPPMPLNPLPRPLNMPNTGAPASNGGAFPNMNVPTYQQPNSAGTASGSGFEGFNMLPTSSGTLPSSVTSSAPSQDGYAFPQ